MPRSDPAPELDPEDFEEFVAATLKVDPKGLSGKHRRDQSAVNEEVPQPETPAS